MTRDDRIVVGLVFAGLVAAGIFMSAAQARSAQRVMAASCMNNQSTISEAIHAATLENNWTNGQPISTEKVTVLLRDGRLPECHGGGQYVISKVGEWPRCTLHGELKMAQQAAPRVSGTRGTPPASAGAAPQVPNGEP